MTKRTFFAQSTTLLAAAFGASSIAGTAVAQQSSAPVATAAPSPAAMAELRRTLTKQWQRGNKMMIEGNAIVAKSSQRQRDNQAKIEKLQREIEALRAEADSQGPRIKSGQQMVADGQKMKADAEAAFATQYPGEHLF